MHVLFCWFKLLQKRRKGLFLLIGMLIKRVYLITHNPQIHDNVLLIFPLPVRHVACRLLYSCGPENPSENMVRKQILMASKTGRTWLDCKYPKLADDFLCLAWENMGVIILLLSAPREAVAFDLLKRVCQRFAASPDLGSALVLHIELLLQRNKELLAKQKIEDVITGHTKQDCPSPVQQVWKLKSSAHIMPYTKSALSMLRSFYWKAKNYSEALQWYNYSLSFYKGGQLDPNLAKLQRNRASCFIHLQQLDRAKEAVTEAGRCDPDDIFTQFSIYKIALLENNAELGPQVLTSVAHLAPCSLALLLNERVNIIKSIPDVTVLFQNEQQDIAVKALESLCEYSEDAKQVLTALRSCISEGTMHNQYYKPFCKLCSTFLHQAPFRMCCFVPQLSLLCPIDSGLLLAQKTCLFMAAACALELYRASAPTSEQADLLTQALEHIQVCWEVWNKLKASDDFAKDQTDTLLLLFEFEARAKLNDPKLETVLESVLEIDNIQPKVLETVAALAMEPPAHFPLLCKKALRMALSLHRKQPHPDLTCCRFAKPTSPESHFWVKGYWRLRSFYEQSDGALSCASQPEDFPELEILWLLTRAWNTGILLYSLAQYPEAEKWCSMGMSFLCHLGSLQESYQTQVNPGGLYSEVLDRLDKAKRNLVMEE
uniref:Protein ZIP4 homolog n=1 Tax=Denticeps clupeoides TaxID=299321 RepID=A0AAY4E931_9TELE